MEREILRSLWQKYGEAVIFDPKKLKAHLLDRNVPKKNINLLVEISTTPYFTDFSKEVVKDFSAREKLFYNVEHDFLFRKESIQFGCDCWTYCFAGRLPEDEPEEHIENESLFDEEWTETDAKMAAEAIREMMK